MPEGEKQYYGKFSFSIMKELSDKEITQIEKKLNDAIFSELYYYNVNENRKVEISDRKDLSHTQL